MNRRHDRHPPSRPAPRPPRAAARALGFAVALGLALAACGPAGPTGPTPPETRAVLAIANPPFGSVRVFTTEGATADLESAAEFVIPASELPYSAVGGPDGRIYVASSTTGTITATAIADVLAADPGAGPARPATTTFSSPDLLNPIAMAFDQRGDLWVSDARLSTPAEPVANHLVRFAAADLAAVADGGSVAAASVLAFAADPEGYWRSHLIYALHVDDLDRLWYTDVYAWSIGRVDGLADRGALETDVVPDLLILPFDPANPVIDAAELTNPVGLAVAANGALYVGSSATDTVARFDGAGGWTGVRTEVAPDARLAVGIDRPRFVALDAEGGLWALTNGGTTRSVRELVRVVGHATVAGDATLTPTERRTWATSGTVLGGGMRFFDR